MKTTRRQLLTGGAIIGGALVAGALSSRRRRGSSPSFELPPPRTPVPGGGWADADAPRRIRQIAKPIEDLVGWPGLGDYLVAVAWTESRGNPRAGGDTGNVARGWFGMRPASARVSELGLPASALKDERYAVALAAWYAHRLRNYRFSGQVMDWFAVRRGWALPSLVSDVDADNQRSQDVYDRFELAVAKAGLPQSFIFRRAFLPGYQWPGVAAVINAAKGAA